MTTEDKIAYEPKVLDTAGLIKKNYCEKIDKYIESATVELEKLVTNNGAETRKSYYRGMIAACDKCKNITISHSIDVEIIASQSSFTTFNDKENFSQAKFFQGMHRGYITCKQYLEEATLDATSVHNNIAYTESSADLLTQVGNKILSKEFEVIETYRKEVVAVADIIKIFAEYGVNIKSEPKF